MDTIEKKYDLKKIKAEIKVLATYQIFLKNQRKTEKLVGKREIEPWEAAMKHHDNRQKLSAMYAAYGVMRGKDQDEMVKLHISEKNEYEFPYKVKQMENFLIQYKLKEEAVLDEN